MADKTHFRAKIGTNRGRRRIWLDGPRLADAGFIGGSYYRCLAKNGHIDCDLLSAEELNEREPLNPPPTGTLIAIRKVTGRPTGKPIIDITGQVVDLAFAEAQAVDVSFRANRIEIRPAN